MLRISHGASPNGRIILRLEGEVRGPWVDELRQLCDQVLTSGSNLILDLTDVSFIDLDGVALCRRLQRRQVTFLHCSPFVTELLKD